MKKNITMKDIAQRLNVSSVTVSKALGDKDGVSDELRTKIKALAEEMGYRYNTLAKSMKEGLSYNIGVVIAERFTDGHQSFYFNFYQKISKILEEYNYYGIFQNLTSKDEKDLVLPKVYYENKVDGFIVLGQVSKEYVDAITNIELPVVFLDFYLEKSDIDTVITDNFYGAYEITNYLMQNGHKEIAFVGDIYATSSIQDRYLGYCKSLLEHKVINKAEYLISDRDEEGKFIELQLLEKMPTAFVCNCDQVAYNLINKLKEKGYRIPEDISVVGFDNDIYATISSPQITTVEVDVDTMAEKAVDILIDKIRNGKESFVRHLVKGNIIYRDSVKKLN